MAHDAADPLARFAAEFHHPYDADGRKLTYLGGHSLGLQPKSVAPYVEQGSADWRRLGVLGHVAAERPWIGCGGQAFIATSLFDPSMSALPIIPKQNSVSVGLFTH